MPPYTTSALCLTCLVVGCHDPGLDEETTQTNETNTKTDTDADTGTTAEESETGTHITDDGDPLPELVAYRSFADGTRDIFFVDPSSGSSQALTVGEFATWFTWSPDGAQIAAALEVGGGTDVFRIGVEDGELVQLTDDPDDERRLRWSPDGQAIAYVSSAGSNVFDVMAVSDDGTATWQISDIPDAEDLNFDWSPDGDQLAVSASTTVGAELFVFEADGSGGHQISVDGQFDQVADPEWSPDGEWIAFSGRDDVFPLLQLVRPDGSELTPSSAAYVSEPSWSPDGQSIAFRGNDQGSFRIGVMALGGDSWYIDDGLADCWAPEWSVDGMRVLFYCQPELDVSSIYLVASAGGVVTPLVDDGLRNDQPAWRPNSAP